MASSVDDRIVSMKFDNAGFEQKMADTLRSLDKLAASLRMTEQTRGLQNLDATAKNMNMNPLAASVDGVSNKFLALATIGITALSNITNKAVDAGLRIAKALSFGPLIEGFKEYETNMNSIQTILANTKSDGSTLNDVNAALEKLNLYSDQTIYNFSQMARNIGTFTAAGVGLDKSVNAIKGIANLAAISGSSSEQASTAMYQLSQALAAGKVSLMDWNSVVNAGMGGEVFKKALFETGKAMKKITDVPVGASFEEWEKKGGTFREQMQKGWITADVLSTTLSAFSGDLDMAGLKAVGFSEKAAKEMIDLGKLGIAAATEVKTVTQLMSTVKESIASGWSQSFKLIVGDFEEAKELFTGLSKMIGHFVEKSSNARNNMLKEWRATGGREALQEAFGDTFGVFAPILDRLGKAFREVFPPMTGQRLTDLIKGFSALAEKITPSAETADKFGRVFRGMFSILEIGITIVKEVVKFIAGMVGGLVGAGGGVLSFSANVGDMAFKLNEVLVAGGGIRRFFDMLREAIQPAIVFIRQISDGIAEFFDNMRKSSGAEAALGRLESRFSGLGSIFEKINQALKQEIPQGLKDVGKAISDWFAELNAKMKAASKPGDFNAGVDIMNAGLLAGVVFGLSRIIKILKGELTFDFGSGIISGIKESFGQLTETMNLMQAQLKSDILMKIAIAIGALTASVLVLSMIDSGALTRALTAMAVGFAQLMGALAVLTAISSGPKGAATITILSTAMLALSSSMVILAGAIKILSTIDPGDMATALAGLAGALTIMITAMNLMATNASGLIAGAVAMNFMSVALIIFSKAVKEFAEISWGDMLKGLVGIAGALTAMVVALNLMPPNMLLTSIGLIAVATAMRIMAEAVSEFGEMSWGQMLKGLAGIGLALVAIAAAMWLMPPGMFLISAGLLQVAFSLAAIAKVVEKMGEMKLGDLVKGLAGLGIMLTLLAVALNAMTGTAAGAAALLVASGALLVLSVVLERLGDMSIAQLVTSLVALAAVFAVLGIAASLLAPTVPALLALAVALGVLGAAMALFGAGAYLIAKAFQVMAVAGVAGMKAMVEAMKIFITFLPELVGALAKALVELAAEILRAAPMLLRLIGALLIQILDTIIELAPKIAEAFAAIITAAVILIRGKFPEIVMVAFEMLMTFLQGIRDNIASVTQVAVEIILNIVNTLTDNTYQLVNAGVNLLLAFLGAIASRTGDIVTAGFNVLLALIAGIANNMFRVVNLAGDIVVAFIRTIGSKAGEIIEAGVQAVIKFVQGIGANINRVVTAAVDVVLALVRGVSDNSIRFTNEGATLIIDFINRLAETIRSRSGELRAAGANLAGAIIDGMTGGLASRAAEVGRSAASVAKGALSAAAGALGIASPSKAFARLGRFMAQGMALGLRRDRSAQNSAVVQAEKIVEAFAKTLASTPDALSGMGELNPVITPVLDLTRVQAEAGNLDRMMASSKIAAGVSLDQADLIARITGAGDDRDDISGYEGPREVQFIQNNFSPKALSTNEIYRNTKSQIVLAKEELDI